MHTLLETLSAELENTAKLVSGWAADDQPVNDRWGWNMVPLSPRLLAKSFERVSKALRETNIESLSEDDEEAIAEVTLVVKGLAKHVIPNLPGNPTASIAILLDTLYFVNQVVSPVLNWIPPNTAYLPSGLARKLQRLEREIDGIVPNKEELALRASAILEAYDAAEAMPTTMQELKSTSAETKQISRQSSELLGKITADGQRSEEQIKLLQNALDEGQRFVTQLADAYRATMAAGLATAFDARAGKLNNTMYWWVGGLAIGLLLIMGVGYVRLLAVKDALAVSPFDSTRVWVQVVLSLLSVGPPLWFSWMATKQISQRFRLSEDYSYKAAVATAYEGFRREAVRIDPAFEKALFASTLSRLDEAPLRLMETQTHGSPIHEIASSNLIDRVLAVVPGFKKDPPQSQSE